MWGAFVEAASTGLNSATQLLETLDEIGEDQERKLVKNDGEIDDVDPNDGGHSADLSINEFNELMTEDVVEDDTPFEDAPVEVPTMDSTASVSESEDMNTLLGEIERLRTKEYELKSSLSKSNADNKGLRAGAKKTIAALNDEISQMKLVAEEVKKNHYAELSKEQAISSELQKAIVETNELMETVTSEKYALHEKMLLSDEENKLLLEKHLELEGKMKNVSEEFDVKNDAKIAELEKQNVALRRALKTSNFKEQLSSMKAMKVLY